MTERVLPLSRGDEIAATLRDEILRSQYRPGERLPSERDLAQRFSTSRGAVREALRKLEQLRIAEVRPGGARVLPVCDASLEALGHLVHLDQPRDPELIDQVLEVVGALVAEAVRIGTDQASAEDRESARKRVARMEDSSATAVEWSMALFEFGHAYVAGSQNMVLRIICRELKTQLLPGVLPLNPVSEPPDPALTRPVLRDLGEALEIGDSAAAGDATRRLWRLIRERARAASEGGE